MNNRAGHVSTNGATGLVRRPSALDGIRVAEGLSRRVRAELDDE
ncbi:hypothetical protein [Streptomyces sp. NPDC057460]